MKKITLTISFLLITAVLTMAARSSAGMPVPEVALAQSGTYSGSGQEVSCRNGSRDFGSFISAVLSYDSFTEYWKDIFVRYNANMCLYNDVDNLLQRITKVREQIRKAFYSCDVTAQKLKSTYYELEAELFFLRRYVAVGNGQLIIKPEKEVYNELRSYFVINKNFLSEERVKQLFDKFKKHYDTRIEAYTNCKDPTWTNLIQKAREFAHTVGGIAPALKEAKESIKDHWKKVTDTPMNRTGDMLWGLLDARINDVDPATAWSDLAKELKQNTPSGYTFEDLQAAQSADIKRHDNEISQAEYMAQYEHLYKNSSGEVVKNTVDRIKTLRDLITNTFPYLNQTFQCTKGILDKAC